MRWSLAAISVVLFLVCGSGTPYAAVQESYPGPEGGPRIVTIMDFFPAQQETKPPERIQATVPASAGASGKFRVLGVRVSPIPPQLQYVHLNASRSNQGQYCVLNIYMIVREGVVLSKDVHIECRPETVEASAGGQIGGCGEALEAQRPTLPASYTTSSDPLEFDQDIAASAP